MGYKFIIEGMGFTSSSEKLVSQTPARIGARIVEIARNSSVQEKMILLAGTANYRGEIICSFCAVTLEG